MMIKNEEQGTETAEAINNIISKGEASAEKVSDNKYGIQLNPKLVQKMKKAKSKKEFASLLKALYQDSLENYNPVPSREIKAIPEHENLPSSIQTPSSVEDIQRFPWHSNW